MVLARHAWDISALLARLNGRGVYSVALLEEQFGPYGFVYGRRRSELWYEGRTTRLPGLTPASVRQQADDADEVLAMDDDDPDDPGELLVEASDIARAVFRLVHPDRTPPSSKLRGMDRRERGFRSDVGAIRRTLRRPRAN